MARQPRYRYRYYYRRPWSYAPWWWYQPPYWQRQFQWDRQATRPLVIVAIILVWEGLKGLL